MSSRTGGDAVAVSATIGGRPSSADELAQLQVVGAEVVAPRGDAVRLVDRDEARLQRLICATRAGSANCSGVMNTNSASPARSASRASARSALPSAELTAAPPAATPGRGAVSDGDLVLLQRQQR